MKKMMGLIAMIMAFAVCGCFGGGENSLEDNSLYSGTLSESINSPTEDENSSLSSSDSASEDEDSSLSSSDSTSEDEGSSSGSGDEEDDYVYPGPY